MSSSNDDSDTPTPQATQRLEEVDPAFGPTVWAYLEGQINEKTIRYPFSKNTQLITSQQAALLPVFIQHKGYEIQTIQSNLISRQHAFIRRRFVGDAVQVELEQLSHTNLIEVNGVALRTRGEKTSLHHNSNILLAAPALSFKFKFYPPPAHSPVHTITINHRIYSYDTHAHDGGVMGVILRAKDVATGQEVAIKRVARSKKAEETYASRDDPRYQNPVTFYRREIDTLQKANHKNVVKLLNFEIPSEFSGDSRIACSLVLEFIGGGNLKEYIASRGPLGESETKRMTWGIVDGLSHLHRQQISHRDLKPANILLTNTVPPQVRIADFGFSKDFGDGSYLRTMLGTPLYQAPEIRKPQVLMSRTYGTAIDSWALGCTIFEMVTGSAEIFVINPSRRFQARAVQATLPEDRCAANLNLTLLQRVVDMSNDCQIIIQSLIVDDAAKRWPCDRVKQSGWFRGFRP